MLRIIILAATAIGGVIAGRQALNRTIEKRLPTEIETAEARAIDDLNRNINDFAREKLTIFALALLIKIGLVSAVYYLFAAGHLSAQGLRIAGGVLVAGFVVRDIIKNLPLISPAFDHIRRHQWSIRRALTEFVAGVAFERAYRETRIRTNVGANKFWISLSKYSVHGISTEIASAVSEVARAVSFPRIRSRALLAGAAGASMFGVYVFFVTVMLTAQ